MATEFPGFRGLICRKSKDSLAETVLVTLEDSVLPPELTRGIKRAVRQSYCIPTAGANSWLIMGGLDRVERTFSADYDVVYVAEATETTENDWECLQRCLRHSAAPYRQILGDCNPASTRHWINHRQTLTRIKYDFQDNPVYWDDATGQYTELGREYVEGTLAHLTGTRRERLYLGKWVAVEGGVFEYEFDGANILGEIPGLPDGQEVGEDWPVYVFIDPGYDHPCAIIWIAIDPEDNIYVFDEIYRGGRTIQDHAQAITERNHNRTVRGYYLDPRNGFSRTAQSRVTIAEQFRECGIQCRPWPRIFGRQVEGAVEKMRQLLAAKKLRVLSRCKETINEFETWQYKRNRNGESVGGDDRFENANNHSMDCLKGFVLLNLRHRRPQITIGR